jgi:hypothetical protein
MPLLPMPASEAEIVSIFIRYDAMAQKSLTIDAAAA